MPLAEWWYNTHFHTYSQLTPYEVVYNQPPPLHLPYLPNESSNEVDSSMLRREAMINTLKYHLQQAQERMKIQVDKHTGLREFFLWVIGLSTVQKSSNQNMAHQYYEPFQVFVVIGKAAYKLQLPVDAKIHDVFHISQLKLFRGTLPIAAHIPSWFQGSDPAHPAVQPAAILQTRVVKFQNATQTQYLVSWVGFEDHEATWEVATDFESRFPTFVQT